MSQGMSPDFALGLRAMMLDGIAREAEITKRVIAAIPDDKSDHRPDEHARTAKELAWHIANTDIQFLDGIADLNFKMESPEHKPQTSAEVVAWYDENIKRGIDRVNALSADQLMTPVEFFGVFNLPAVAYLGFLNNHSIHHRGELATYLRPWDRRCLRSTAAATMSRSCQRARKKLPLSRHLLTLEKPPRTGGFFIHQQLTFLLSPRRRSTHR